MIVLASLYNVIVLLIHIVQCTKMVEHGPATGLNHNDFFCNSSCILFENCCLDHMDTCEHFYDDTSKYCSFTSALIDAAPLGVFVTCLGSDKGDQTFSCSSSGETLAHFTGSSLQHFIAWVNSDECKPKCDR